LITLDVQDANHAVGRFLAAGGYFMPLRDSVDDSTAGVTSRTQTTAQNHPRRTALGPRETFYHQHMRFLLTVALPDVSVGQHGPSLDDLIIADHTGSSARLDSAHHGSFLVTETGPRALWTEVEQIHHLWHDCQQPRREQNDVLLVLPETVCETLQHEDGLSAGHLTAQPRHVEGLRREVVRALQKALDRVAPPPLG
jgi:hypothetical protein